LSSSAWAAVERSKDLKLFYKEYFMSMSVSQALASRRSVRGFLDTPVENALVRDILTKAARAPSGGNLQPWQIYVVSDKKLMEFKKIMAARVMELPTGEPTEYDIYPKILDDSYKARRFEVGEGLYGALGIPRDNKIGRMMWFANNFQFFGAPLALFCYLDRNMGPPQWSDAGMYLQSVMLLLREAGLDSCPQECWAVYPKTVSNFLGAPDTSILFTGMSIGYKDETNPVNDFVPGRVALDEFCTFV
jgi:nitroreductase